MYDFNTLHDRQWAAAKISGSNQTGGRSVNQIDSRPYGKNGGVLCRMRLRWVLLHLVLVTGCTQGTTSPATTVLIVNGYTIEARFARIDT